MLNMIFALGIALAICAVGLGVIQLLILTFSKRNPGAIPIVTHCPICTKQHVDRGKWAHRLHRKHLCETCGHTWEPVPGVYTVGVEEMPL